MNSSEFGVSGSYDLSPGEIMCLWHVSECACIGVVCTSSAHMSMCGVCAHTWTQERCVTCGKAGNILKLALCRAQPLRERVVRVGVGEGGHRSPPLWLFF